MQLLEHFKALTLNPKNAKELKGLILQLAVQGKLTAQWREENPDLEIVTDVLERIKGKGFKPDIFDNDIPFKLNKSWTWTRFIDVASLRHGHQFRKYDFVNEGIPVIKIGQCKADGTLDFSKCDFIEESRKVEFKDYLINKGDLLMALTGGTLGKVTRVDKDYGIIVQNYRVGNFFTNESILSLDYLNVILESNLFQRLVAERINQNAQPNIGKDNIEKILMPIPPLEEQKAIVEVVNTLFKEVEQLEQLTQTRVKLKTDFVSSALQELTQAAEQDTATQWAFLQEHFSAFFTEKANVKKLRESILQLAVQGKLTKHWRSENPNTEEASVLLDRIKAEKNALIKAKKIRKDKAFPSVTLEEEPYVLPKGWAWSRFQEIFDIRDGTHDSPKDAIGSNTYPLITSKNFKGGQIDVESSRCISEEDYNKVIQRSQVHTGDMLFSMIGGNIGNQVEVGDFTEFAIKNVALFKHYKYGLPAPGFLKLFSQFIAMSLQSEAAGGAQPFVSLKFFRNLIVGLPPEEEQKAMVQKVNALMALCDTLEKEIETHQTTQENWMKSCLKEVFEGVIT